MAHIMDDGLFGMYKKYEYTSPREIFLKRAKENGSRTTFIDGKEFAIIEESLNNSMTENSLDALEKMFNEMEISANSDIEDLEIDIEGPFKSIQKKLDELANAANYITTKDDSSETFNITDTYNSLKFLKSELDKQKEINNSLEMRIQELEDSINGIQNKKNIKKYI